MNVRVSICVFVNGDGKMTMLCSINSLLAVTGSESVSTRHSARFDVDFAFSVDTYVTYTRGTRQSFIYINYPWFSVSLFCLQIFISHSIILYFSGM